MHNGSPTTERAPQGGGELGGAPVPPPAAPIIWKTTPFLGDYNPGTKLSQDIFHRKQRDSMKQIVWI